VARPALRIGRLLWGISVTEKGRNEYGHKRKRTGFGPGLLISYCVAQVLPVRQGGILRAYSSRMSNSAEGEVGEGNGVKECARDPAKERV
jgi:hypothetical protein